MHYLLRPTRLLVPATALWLAGTVASQAIHFQPSLEAARKLAAEGNQVMLVAVVMPGERGSDAMIEHYGDAEIRKLCQQCVCYRLDVGTAQPSDDEREVLQSYLGAAPREAIVVPHHVIVHPDGKTVLSSAAWQMTAGQLEWFVADGIRRLDAKFEWPLGERARAPDGLRYGDAEKGEREQEPPPSPAEVKAAIGELKKGGTGWGDSIQYYTVLLRSDQSAAVKYVDTQLSGGRNMMTSLALPLIGEISPVAWSPVLCKYLDDRTESNRENAARGLAKMAHDKTNKAIKKQLKDEKEPKVRAWLLRAAAATGPTDKATIAALEKALTDEQDKDVRMHAAVAAGVLEDKDEARRLLHKALADADPLVRSAAAYAMASRRDAEFAAVLEVSLPGEKDAEAKHWLELAFDTLVNKRDLREFKNFREKVLGERTTGNRGGAGGGAGVGGGGLPGGGDK